MTVRNSAELLHSSVAVQSDNRSDKLPARDYLLLPLLSIFTIAFMFAVTEISARSIWPAELRDACLVYDPIIGPHHKPNCVTHIKAAETPWVVERFNNCGYRTEASCGPKPPGTVRVVLMGSSLAEGYLVPYAETFAAKVGEQLRRMCQKPVEFQNMGIESFTPIFAYRRLPEALALQPDVVMLALTPFDIEHGVDPKVLANLNDPQPIKIPRREVKVDIGHRIKDTLSQSRTVLLAQHFLYKNERTYAKLFLLEGEHAAFLRSRFTPAWEKHFVDLDLLLGQMAARLHASNIPFVLTAIPHKAEAALLTAHGAPPGVDPYAFDRRIAQIAAKHNIVYTDVFDDFSRLPNADALFHPENGHMTPEGHAILADAVVRQLVGGAVPVFSNCSNTNPKK